MSFKYMQCMFSTLCSVNDKLCFCSPDGEARSLKKKKLKKQKSMLMH